MGGSQLKEGEQGEREGLVSQTEGLAFEEAQRQEGFGACGNGEEVVVASGMRQGSFGR